MFAKVKPIISYVIGANHRSSSLIFNNQKIHTALHLQSKEVEKAKQAAKIGTQKSTIFDKIISKEIPIDLLYEDKECLAFNDIAPQAPVHFLVIPKHRIDMVENTRTEDHKTLGHLVQIAGQLGKEKAPNGFRLVINNGSDGCQSIHHLHVHVLGGRQLKWPPG